MTIPFAIPEAAASLSVTSTTARVALVGSGTQVLLKNVGGTECFVKVGSVAVVATTSCMSVPAGEIATYSISPTATHIAAITASGTTTLRIARGNGG
jgi:hypothetical protein